MKLTLEPNESTAAITLESMRAYDALYLIDSAAAHIAHDSEAFDLLMTHHRVMSREYDARQASLQLAAYVRNVPVANVEVSIAHDIAINITSNPFSLISSRVTMNGDNLPRRSSVDGLDGDGESLMSIAILDAVMRHLPQGEAWDIIASLSMATVREVLTPTHTPDELATMKRITADVSAKYDAERQARRDAEITAPYAWKADDLDRANYHVCETGCGYGGPACDFATIKRPHTCRNCAR